MASLNICLSAVRRRLGTRFAVPAAISFLALAMAAPAAAAVPAVTATIPVGGDPFGVAVNPLTGTVYVTNVLSETVSVISGRTGTVTATIPVLGIPLGIAVNPLTGTVYTIGTGILSVISGRTGMVTATIPAAGAPDAVAVNAVTGTVYVANGESKTVSVISGRTGTVTATITVVGHPRAVAVNPLTGAVYVAGSGIVSVISGRTDTVTATITVGSDPQGVAVNPLANTVYVTNEVSGTVSVISCWRPLTRLFLQRDRLTPTSAASVTSLAWVRPASRLRCRGPPCCGSDRSRRFAFAGVCGPGQPGATARRSPPTPA